MYAVAGRRLAVISVLVVLVGALLGSGPVQATTGSLTYTCDLPVLGATDFSISSDTNAPATLYLGKSFTPTLTSDAQVPVSLANLAASDLKATSVDGTMISTVTVNGVATQVSQTFAKRTVPASSTEPLALTATGAMPSLTASRPGSVTYVPGDLVITLNFYPSGGGKASTFSDMACGLHPTTRIIDKVSDAKSPTRTTGTAAYAKKSKKVTAVAKVAASSGAVPTGKVTVALYKGGTKLKTVTKALAAGKASVVFTGVKAKGAYKVVTSYPGTSLVSGSSSSKSFTIH
jgi:hypothetical protein